ncbi:unnamed protein product [Cuscuta campestris]|uniref:N-acetyltransferase domain-containing protein n=2 Tax=Cuscuta sect. Cleistogrammica TaxID=1824901 RepID=A0A484KIU3_9ASTE|nr:hypothetical protein DM860_009250 [Cuscuta australis]VFQ64788.1 unnamed protein product [Cuscuta campestris]
MRALPFGADGVAAAATSSLSSSSSPPSVLADFIIGFCNKIHFQSSPTFRASSLPSHASSISPLPRSGLCRASQIAKLFPTTVSPEVVVREARLEDWWEVAETHCSSFFPDYSFPLDFVLRIDRLVAMLSGFSVPKGCERTCLVAVTGRSSEEEGSFFLPCDEGFKMNGILSLVNKGYVSGVLTVDTIADFIPRRGPLRQRRRGIAYISNVAVREGFRRKGIAKKLIAKAEAKARSWGCRAIALHCDASNPGPTRLYVGLGFKMVKVPQGSNWPQPPTISPDVRYCFMMKLLHEH